ncbi:MAG: hypothetical protein ACLQIB_46070, partial [Isosphaeraceae bacterium]
MCVKLVGYSERGMVNALCDDIRYAENPNTPLGRLEEFLRWCHFPLAEPQPVFMGIARAKLLVEQSFSDFGDLDLLILLEYERKRKKAILVEAKVCTDTGSWKRIEDQWADFETYLAGDPSKTSSLFVQMYRKLKLLDQVDDPHRTLAPDAVSRRWSLGNNRVVRQAATSLSEYREDPWYLAIIPDRCEVVDQFFRDCLRSFAPPITDLPAWDVSKWGFITWPELHEKTRNDRNEWQQLQANFVWNKHQIFPIQEPAVGRPAQAPERAFRLHGDNTVYVAGPSTRNCRVVPLVWIDGRFPKSYLVPTENLG